MTVSKGKMKMRQSAAQHDATIVFAATGSADASRSASAPSFAAVSPNRASGAESKAVCTEAGMFALRERRVHVTQEDFEMAVSKVMQKDSEKNVSVTKLFV